MKHLGILFLAASLIACDPTPADEGGASFVDWKVSFDGSDAPASATALDATGATILAAILRGQASFGGGVLGDAGGGLTLVMAKYSAAGVHLWSRAHAGGFAATSGLSLGTDSGGDVLLLVTDLAGPVNLGFGEENDDLVAKIDGVTGAPLWSDGFANGTRLVRPRQLAVRGDGSIAVVGTSQDTVDDLGNPISPGPNELFVQARGSSDGAPLWTVSFGDADSTAQGAHVATGPDGDVFVSGSFTGLLPMGATALDADSTAGVADHVIARLAGENGVVGWRKHLAALAALPDEVEVAVDRASDVVVSGLFQDPADTTDDVLVPPPQLITLKLSGVDGASVWRKALAGDDGTLVPGPIVCNSQGHLVSSGILSGAIAFESNGVATRGDDFILYLQKRSGGNGAEAWVRFAGGSGDVQARGVSVAPDDHLLVGGAVRKPESAGSTTMIDQLFLLRLAP